MIWILTTILILFRRLQWWIAVALLRFEHTQRVAPFYHEVLPLLKYRAGSSHERNLIGTRVSLPKRLQWVAPFCHPSIHQLSTLEKTKLCHRPILSSVLCTSFQRIFLWWCPGAWLVSRPTTGVTVLSYSSAFALQGLWLSVAFLLQAFWCRRWQIWGSPCNKAHHWSWLCCDSFFAWFCLRSFRHYFRTLCRTEMAIVETRTKDDSIHHVWNFLWSVCLRVVFWCQCILIWILGFKLIRSNK